MGSTVSTIVTDWMLEATCVTFSDEPPRRRDGRRSSRRR